MAKKAAAAESTAIVVPKEVSEQASRIVAQAQATEIKSVEDYDATTVFMELCAERITGFDKIFDPNISRLHHAHKSAVAEKKQFTQQYERAIEIIKFRRIEFRSIAERERQRRESAARLAAQIAQTAQLQAHAKTLESQGDTAAAAEVRQMAETAPAPIVVVAPEVKDVPKVWKFRIVNESAIPRQWLIPDEKAIGVHARSMQEKASIPGVEFYSEDAERIKRS